VHRRGQPYSTVRRCRQHGCWRAARVADSSAPLNWSALRRRRQQGCSPGRGTAQRRRQRGCHQSQHPRPAAPASCRQGRQRDDGARGAWRVRRHSAWLRRPGGEHEPTLLLRGIAERHASSEPAEGPPRQCGVGGGDASPSGGRECDRVGKQGARSDDQKWHIGSRTAQCWPPPSAPHGREAAIRPERDAQARPEEGGPQRRGLDHCSFQPGAHEGASAGRGRLP